MARRSKKYRAALEKVERGRTYGAREALQLAKDTLTVNFDPTVDVALRLGIDPRRADQMVRGAVVLPRGTGRTARVAVIAAGEAAIAAEEAGADVIGSDDVIERLGRGELIDELDTIIATPDQMGKLGRLGRLLGPRGLMPNPKSGTVRTDVARAVREVKAGKVEYRSDRQGNVHSILGKASFPLPHLLENYQTLLDEIVRQRPASAKGRYIRNITVSTSMGPGIRVDPTRTRDVAEQVGV
ncbi:MAG: 50S ribosomal protein L1 [Actinomycetota bacterium]|nr:50S ribosomal protein L1 [Actinomycetota bacterium]